MSEFCMVLSELFCMTLSDFDRCDITTDLCDNNGDCGSFGNCRSFGQVRRICDCNAGYTGETCDTLISELTLCVTLGTQERNATP